MGSSRLQWIDSRFTTAGFARTASSAGSAAKAQEPSATKTQVSNDSGSSASSTVEEKPQRKQTMAEADEELRHKLEAMSGGGGEAGLELEDGKPVAMKRSVKENMFRLI
ncbi:MAG: hypothetical protein Q9191_006352 [Dirinaria sp. TL-2023a]